jgi:hypothetical protein
MGKIKYREKENIITVMDGDTVIAKYEVDRHWQEKNVSVKEDGIYIRLYNRMRGFQDCKVELNSDKVQKIP